MRENLRLYHVEREDCTFAEPREGWYVSYTDAEGQLVIRGPIPTETLDSFLEDLEDERTKT